MIPLEIRLTNFLSFRQEAVVDLRAVHLACISGANGAGKSTLLDAMTWALFGQSRARSDDDLVNTSARDGAGAEVELVFDMEGAVYRVLRRKRRNKSTELEFQIESPDPNDQGWVSLTEARMRETQAAIERVLRMNYDIFVNASFFLQGKADEFTSRTASRRKEILAEVLGVTQWDDYAKQVANERKSAETEGVVLRRRLEEVAAELSQSEERQQRLSEALAQETSIRTRVEDKEGLLQQARQLEALVEQQKQQVDARAAELLTIDRELARLQQRIEELSRDLAQHENLASQTDQIEIDFATWSEADAAFQMWRALAEQVHALETERSPLQMHLTAERSSLEQRRRGLETQQQAIAAGQAEMEALRQDHDKSRKHLGELQMQAKALEAGAEALRELELEAERLTAERKQREQEHQRLLLEQQRISAVRAERAKVEQEQQTAVARAETLAAELAALAVRGEQRAAWMAESEQVALNLEQLKADAEQEKDRIAQLAVETGGDCPLCGQPLTITHRREVVAQLESDLDQKRQLYRATRERAGVLESQLAAQGDLGQQRMRLQSEYEAQQKAATTAAGRLQTIDDLVSHWTDSGAEAQLAELQLWAGEQPPDVEKAALMRELRADAARKVELDKEISEQQQQMTRTESRLQQLEQLAVAWQTVGHLELQVVVGHLEAEDFLPDERRQLAAIQRKLDALGYDAAEHQAVQQRRQKLVAAPERYQALRQAQAAIKPLEEALAESTRQHSDRLAQQAEVRAQFEAGREALESLRGSAVDSAALESGVIRLREELSLASQNVGAAKQKVTVLEDRRRQNSELIAAQYALERRIQQLKVLEEACGRKGVQALLIEHALPEIEERANELLDRLSGGAMRVTFDTQRELKSGGISETLEIRIADSAGVRPYENFSGGEQFRVNFAVRLALSHVLATRSGARLRTLVIDEGFGSQDPEGRQRLVEAINAVQSDFACVLVITHLDDLRDAFPARIEVTKAGDGSRVNVVAEL